MAIVGTSPSPATHPAMRLRIVTPLTLAVALHARPIAAQEMLAGLRYTVPAGFARDAARSDSVTAVYRTPQADQWLMVAVVRSVDERPGRVGGLLQRIGKAALGAATAPPEWVMTPGNAPEPSTPFYQYFESMGGERNLNVSLRQVHAGRHDLLVGNAVLSHDESPFSCFVTMSVPANKATEQLIGSLLGRPPAELRPGRGLPSIMGPVQGGPPAERSAAVETRAGQGMPPPDPEAARVLAVYSAYTTALGEHRVAAAAELVTPATLAFYADLRTLALHGGPAQVRALPYIQRSLVLGLRHRLTAERLSGMTPGEVLAFAAENEARFNDGVTPGSPVVRGDAATVPLLNDGRPTVYIVDLERGDAGWRLDLLPFTAQTGCRIRRMIRRRGMGPDRDDEMILRVLERTTGRAPSPDIWQPLVRATPAGR